MLIYSIFIFDSFVLAKFIHR